MVRTREGRRLQLRLILEETLRQLLQLTLPPAVAIYSERGSVKLLKLPDCWFGPLTRIDESERVGELVRALPRLDLSGKDKFTQQWRGKERQHAKSCLGAPCPARAGERQIGKGQAIARAQLLERNGPNERAVTLRAAARRRQPHVIGEREAAVAAAQEGDGLLWTGIEIVDLILLDLRRNRAEMQPRWN